MAPPEIEILATDIPGLTAELVALKDESDKRETAHKKAAADLTARLSAIETAHAEALAAKDKELSDKDADHVAALASKDADIESAKKSAAEQARNELRKAGHDPVPIDTPKDDIVAQYKALKPGAEREAFRAKHLEEIQSAYS